MAIAQKNRTGATDPVAGGFYTVREAARLLNIGNHARVTAWLQGHKRSKAGPVLQRQYEVISSTQEIGFWDLLEIRFVDHFRAAGVSLPTLRKAAQVARREWKQQHPFATSKAKYFTDRKNIFRSTAEEEKDTVLYNLVTRQLEMYEVIENFIDKGLRFDVTSGLAEEWVPRAKEFPNIVVNPLLAYGKPAILPAGVPTSAIFQTWKAEDGSYAAVADWYGIDGAMAREAVEFELGLPN